MKKNIKQSSKKSTKKSYRQTLLEEKAARISKYGATLADCLEYLDKEQNKAKKKNSKIDQEIIGKMKYYIGEIEFQQNKERYGK